MALPRATTGSLWPAFAPARLVGLAVKLPVYQYALRTIADRAEGTFALLRYFLGGNRPSQTDHQTLSRAQIHGSGLDYQLHKASISPMTNRCLTTPDQRLLAILHMGNQEPMSEYSKGSWGLSVLLRVAGIFTGISISPRSSLRQCSDRYTIRAGRNLPDKEFRYLRTVIVTADIHQAFSSELRLYEYKLTPCFKLLALVTCHTLYILFRVRRVLCFW